jgi:glycosyltransferase involved in cell wall biosynthesis
MKREPVVSVIVIFFDEEKFIIEAIESVIEQVFDEWELLLVDDGSTDGSSDIARYYASRYPQKIRYLQHDNHQNRGASASRNLGLHYASGRYIAFLDADDVWMPHKLLEQVPILDSQPDAAMLYGNTEYWYSWTGKLEDKQLDFMPLLGVPSKTLVKPPELVPLFLTGKAAVPCTCSILVRREAIKSIGGFEEDFRYVFTDQVFYIKLCLNVSVFVCDQCWDRYRQHPESCCHVMEKSGRMAAARLRFLKWCEEYVEKYGIRDRRVRQAIKEELRPYRHPALHRLLSGARQLRAKLEKLMRLTAWSILPASIRCWLRSRWRGHKNALSCHL